MPTGLTLTDRVSEEIDRSTATLLVRGDDAETKHFILETLLIGAAAFLLHKYLEGFAKGAHLEELGEKHGAIAARLNRHLASGHEVPPDELATSERDAQEGFTELADSRSNGEARTSAEKAVVDTLLSRGASTYQAQTTAHRVGEGLWGE
jgi:hypothetical protein